MDVRIKKSKVTGHIAIPGSKSHTIRALFIASLAEGFSEIHNPLLSGDTMAAIEACRSFGAEITINNSVVLIKGVAGKPAIPGIVINVKNSGTTLRFAASVAGLARGGWTVLTGDSQVCRRPMQPLIDALNNLGAEVFSTRNSGTAPVVVKGGMEGGETELDAVTSQYLSSLLVTAPLLEKDTRIIINSLNEVPYVEMTLKWLDDSSIIYKNRDFNIFEIKGNQGYKAIKTSICGDFSSATFFAVLSAISQNPITLENLDMQDTQGDREVLRLLEKMGINVEYADGKVSIKGGTLKGIEADMNSIPDALPAMAVAGCFAEGETRLVNVPQARIKETDRIAAMCTQLREMGASIYELSDGLVVRKSPLIGCRVNGYHDHRIVMALTIAGLNSNGITTIEGAEAASVTFPSFFELLEQKGGRIEYRE